MLNDEGSLSVLYACLQREGQKSETTLKIWDSLSNLNLEIKNEELKAKPL